MRRRLILALVILLSACRQSPHPLIDQPRLAPGTRMQDVVFHSIALDRDMPYRVILPAQISPGHRLPVVYLLHGFGDSWKSWSNQSDVAQYAARGLILVMIEGGISYYMNSATSKNDRYEDYFLHDLVPDVERRFPAISSRSGRAIIGISMGGFAVLKFALSNPDQFAVAAALSPPVDILHRPFRLQRWGEWWRIRGIFGPRNSATCASRDPLALVHSVPPETAPFIYLGAGKGEPLLGPIRQFSQTLNRLDLPHELHENPGAHEWSQWNRQIPEVFDVLFQHGIGIPVAN